MLRVALAPLPARPWAPEAVAAAGAEVVDDPADAEVLIFLAPDDTAGLTTVRKSVLDTITQDAHDLSARLGTEDRQRLEKHLDG